MKGGEFFWLGQMSGKVIPFMNQQLMEFPVTVCVLSPLFRVTECSSCSKLCHNFEESWKSEFSRCFIPLRLLLTLCRACKEVSGQNIVRMIFVNIYTVTCQSFVIFNRWFEAEFI
jgi:hypothetical protein